MAVAPADVPAALGVVRDFVNTLDRDEGTDELESRKGLSTWLASADLVEPGEPVETTEAELELALRFRVGLRRALELNHDGVTEPVPALQDALAELPVSLAWDGAAPVLTTSASGALGGLARVALAAHEAVSSGEWVRLKICAFDECEWAYVDHSKNRSRAYCEYGCGNKLKTRAYRARQRAGAR
jgi:predicted RNA-binding Zn ribbon-like protein